MRDTARDLVEALLEIARDREHVAGVAHGHLLAQVDAELEIVGLVEGRDAPDALRPEARARAVGGAAVERDAQDRRIVLGDVADVLDIGRLQEGVDAGEVGQLAAREGRDGAVGQALGTGQAHVERPLLLLAPAVLGQLALGLDRLPAQAVELVVGGMVMAAATRQRCRGQAAGDTRSWWRSMLWYLPRVVALEIVGDRRPECVGRLRIRRTRSKVSTLEPSLKASPISWVTMNTVIPVSRHSSVISSCMSLRMPGSSAPNGSSSSNILGLRISA